MTTFPPSLSRLLFKGTNLSQALYLRSNTSKARLKETVDCHRMCCIGSTDTIYHCVACVDTIYHVNCQKHSNDVRFKMSVRLTMTRLSLHSQLSTQNDSRKSHFLQQNTFSVPFPISSQQKTKFSMQANLNALCFWDRDSVTKHSAPSNSNGPNLQFLRKANTRECRGSAPTGRSEPTAR